MKLAVRDLADRLLGPVLEAGRIEMHYYESGVATEAKSDNTPVTAADREAEAVLLAALAAIAPGVPVVAEEAWSSGAVVAPGERFFLVDPLDGTREFIEHRGEFTVNVALIEQGKPVFGMIYAPALGELCATIGAREVIAAAVAPSSQANRLDELDIRRIEARAPNPESLVAVASRSHGNAETEAVLARYRIGARRNAGSSLKFCLLARGEADLYPRLGPTREWDIAAGHAILAAAGGYVLSLDGTAVTYGHVDRGFLSPHFLAWGRTIVAAGQS